MQQETEPFPRNGMTLRTFILLVEDDPANAQLFLRILSQETSYRAFWATSGRAALHFTQHVKPQLFLLDYSLPDMTGIQLYDRLHVRKELEAVPALIMGACLEKVGDDIKQRGLLAVANPFDPDEFLSTVESTLASSSRKPEW
jgi:DNA-binding response OmpR family regulator